MPGEKFLITQSLGLMHSNSEQPPALVLDRRMSWTCLGYNGRRLGSQNKTRVLPATNSTGSSVCLPVRPKKQPDRFWPLSVAGQRTSQRACRSSSAVLDNQTGVSPACVSSTALTTLTYRALFSGQEPANIGGDPRFLGQSAHPHRVPPAPASLFSRKV